MLGPRARQRKDSRARAPAFDRGAGRGRSHGPPDRRRAAPPARRTGGPALRARPVAGGRGLA